MNNQKNVRKQLDRAMVNIKAIYNTTSFQDLTKEQQKSIDNAMDAIDTAQHKVGGKDMDYYYRDTLDTDIREIADSIDSSHIKQAKSFFHNALDILYNHIDFDSDLQNQLADILEDVQDDIHDSNNSTDRDISASEVRGYVKPVDDLLDYNCGVLD